MSKSMRFRLEIVRSSFGETHSARKSNLRARGRPVFHSDAFPQHNNCPGTKRIYRVHVDIADVYRDGDRSR